MNRHIPNHYAPAGVLAARRTQAGRPHPRGDGARNALLAGAAWSGAAWHRSQDLDAAAAATTRRADGYEARYRAERRPASEVAPADIALAVETVQRLAAARVGALPVLRTVSEALAGFPDLTLESLEWFEISERDGWVHAPVEDAPRERFRVVLLRGRVEAHAGHYRAAADEVFRFAEGLEANPRLSEVDVTDLPSDPGRGAHRHPRQADFAMRMVLDVGSD